jgi:hypothetical protein
MLAGVLAPIRSVMSGLGQGLGAIDRVPFAGLLSPLAMLILIAGIYSLNEPDVGMNGTSAVLFFSLLIGSAIITYIYEGGQVLFARHRLHLPAGVRLFPFALCIAVLTVILSRLVDFRPTVIYGFVAAAAILTPVALDRRSTALSVFLPAIALFAVAMGAWALLIPLRDVANEGDWWTYVPGEVAALLFVAGIEGLLFSMLPLRFNDGSKVFAWSRLVWMVTFVGLVFLFAWAILNPEAKQFDALLEGRVILAVSVVGAYGVLGVLTWLFFHLSNSGEKAAAEL